ncbi:MAG: carboxypeptidase regulatory-like domain-containing protein [bacterium]|nr:carboxypeptidase regulatory-like domain-containing protein [bacterium]
MRAFLGAFSLLCGLLTPLTASAQPDSLWSVRFYVNDGANLISPTIYAALEIADGGFVVAGDADPSAGFSDAFVARITAEGAVSWYRTLGRSNSDEVATGVVETPGGNLMVVGYGGTGVTPNLVMIWGVSPVGDSLWSRSYGSSGWTQGNDICLLPDGNVAIVGFRLGANLVRSDLWLLKCTPAGDTLWTKTIGGSNTDVGNRVLAGPNGQLIIGASSRTYGQGHYDVWILLTDSAGQVLSSHSSGTAVMERCYGMLADDSTIYVAGIAGDTLGSESDGYLVKADTSGQVIRAQPYSAGFTNETFRGCALRFDGAVRCVGWAGSGAANPPQPWIANITPAGMLQESWVNNGFQQGQFYGIIPVTDGGHLIFGTITEGGLHKGYVFRIGNGAGIAGTVTEVELGEPLAGVRVDVEGGAQSALTDALGRFHMEIRPGIYSLIVSGPCVSSDTTADITVIADSTAQVNLTAGVPRYEATQTSVNIVAHNRIPSGEPFTIYNRGSGAMSFSVITESVSPVGNWLSASPAQGTVPPHDSAVVDVIVTADEPNGGIYDYYGYLSVRAHACPDSADHVPVLATVLDASERGDGLPTEFALPAAYPNPFNAATRLSYSLPRATRIRLSVYDIAGRLARVIDEGRREAGRYEFLFSAAGWPSGVYLLSLESEAFSATQKLLLLK